jgi:2-polyprenyl-3-methyl-5-hydroxy-6-metoxy-1,4-benzoquinol methylase
LHDLYSQKEGKEGGIDFARNGVQALKPPIVFGRDKVWSDAVVEQSLNKSITDAVAIQYNSFPYPNDPMFIKPRWQESYRGASLFAGRLLLHNCGITPSVGRHENLEKRILLAGCGDTQPYISRQLEPKSFRLDCVDLSKASLRRAALRVFPFSRNMNFVHEDLLYFCERKKEAYDHIEACGVLNHLADSESMLMALFESLKPSGTMRIMVYNTTAREWIHHLISVFRLLDFSPYSSNDLNDARVLLWLLRRHISVYAEKLERLGHDALENNARFVDTFFHVREIRRPIHEWFDLLKKTGFVPFALWDEWGQLDDLSNPLWVMPDKMVLESKVVQREFTEDLELFLYKPDLSAALASKNFPKNTSWRWHRSPPKFWKNYPELKNISFWDVHKLWRDLPRPLTQSAQMKDYPYPERVLKRLARLGVLIRSGETSSILDEKMAEPIKSPSVNTEAEVNSVVKELPIAITRFVTEILLQKKKMELKRLQLIEERLRRASLK